MHLYMRGSAPRVYAHRVPRLPCLAVPCLARLDRRVRESYRLLRNSYPLAEGERVDAAFVYVADRVKSYRSVLKNTSIS